MRILLEGSYFFPGLAILGMMGLAAVAVVGAIVKGIVNLFKKRAR